MAKKPIKITKNNPRRADSEGYRAWTPEEDDKLRRLTAEGRKIGEIADILGRTAASVERYKKTHKIRKSYNKVPVRQSRLKEKAREWKESFLRSDRYQKLRTILTESELRRFTQDWVAYHVQLDDITIAEQDQIEHMLFTKLRMEDNQKSLKAASEREEQLRRQFGGRLDQDMDLENEQDLMLHELLQGVNSAKREINVEYQKLDAIYKTCQEELNLSREQREKDKRVGADTFFTWVKQFTERDRREKEGRREALFNMAREKKLQELKAPHKFENGDIEPIILDGRDYLDPESVPVVKVKKEEPPNVQDSTNNGN